MTGFLRILGGEVAVLASVVVCGVFKIRDGDRLLISILVRHTNGSLTGEPVVGEFFVCSDRIPLNVAILGVSLAFLNDFLVLVGVFSLESVLESESKLRSFRELLQLSVSAMRHARLLRARLLAEDVVVWKLPHEWVEDGVLGS